MIEPVLRDAILNRSPGRGALGRGLRGFSRRTTTGVTATLRTVETGATETVRCDFLAGCDGGSIIVRDKLGIGLDGRPPLPIAT